jgi:hypothetical protein
MRVSTIQRHLREALGDDPRLALAAVRLISEEDLPWLEDRAVRYARWHGYSWARIGRLLLRSRQSVRERFRHLDDQPLLWPQEDVDDAARAIHRSAMASADRRRQRELDAWAAEGGIVPW